MWKQGAIIAITDPETGRQIQTPAYVCRHCQKIVTVAPLCQPTDIGRKCGGCDGFLCPRCSTMDGCSHIEKRCEAIERREAWRRHTGAIT